MAVWSERLELVWDASTAGEGRGTMYFLLASLRRLLSHCEAALEEEASETLGWEVEAITPQ